MTDVLAVVSTLIAAAGLVFSGWQLRLIHQDRVKDRKLGVEGVCLSWHAVAAPNEADVDADGEAVWTYVFRLDNPGCVSSSYLAPASAPMLAPDGSRGSQGCDVG